MTHSARIGTSVLACMAVMWSCASAPTLVQGASASAAFAAPDGTGTVDFATIERLSESYRVMRYETDAVIQATLGEYYDEVTLVDLPTTKNRYLIGTLRGQHRQEIYIRGTANGRNVLYDLRFSRHYNERLGINLHKGFEEMALAVYQDILPRLDRSDDLVLFGHSLGAAEAVILSMLLVQDGFHVAKVYASGGPRVTDLAGEKKYDVLPILRVVNQGDPVPFLPPRDIPDAADPYVHIGPAVLLLDGPAYSLLRDDIGDEVLASTFWKSLGQEGVRQVIQEHLIPAYIERLKPKLKYAIQVPFAERMSYITAKK